jgi:hypothetical protein
MGAPVAAAWPSRPRNQPLARAAGPPPPLAAAAWAAMPHGGGGSPAPRSPWPQPHQPSVPAARGAPPHARPAAPTNANRPPRRNDDIAGFIPACRHRARCNPSPPPHAAPAPRRGPAPGPPPAQTRSSAMHAARPARAMHSGCLQAPWRAAAAAGARPRAAPSSGCPPACERPWPGPSPQLGTIPYASPPLCRACVVFMNAGCNRPTRSHAPAQRSGRWEGSRGKRSSCRGPPPPPAPPPTLRQGLRAAPPRPSPCGVAPWRRAPPTPRHPPRGRAPFIPPAAPPCSLLTAPAARPTR